MKTVYINISLRPDARRRQIPVGLGYVITATKTAGIDFDLIDMDIDYIDYNQLEKLLVEKKYDVFAFGAIVSGFKIVREISSIIRKVNDGAIIIAGNSVASSIPDTLMEYTEVDIGILGEADITIVDLLKCIQNEDDIKNVQGIFYKDSGKVKYTAPRAMERNIDVFPFPEWELFDLEKYFQDSKINTNSFDTGDMDIKWLPLSSGRGCPYSCTFCYITVRDEKKRYRRYSYDMIMEEMYRLHYKYGANYIRFWDDLTFPNKSILRKMISGFKELDFQFYWDAPVRGDLFKEKDFDLLQEVKSTGCDNLAFSLENADTDILKAIDKHLNIEQFIGQAKVLRKANITPLTSIIFGYPQETPQSIKHTLDVCEEAGVYPSTGFLLALPGTPVYDWARKNGYIPNEFEYLMKIGDRQDFHMNFTNMDSDFFMKEVSTGLEKLANKQGLAFENPFKTVRYQKPKIFKN